MAKDVLEKIKYERDFAVFINKLYDNIKNEITKYNLEDDPEKQPFIEEMKTILDDMHRLVNKYPNIRRK